MEEKRMSNTRWWAGARTLTLGLGALAASGARAATSSDSVTSFMQYSTSGTVGLTGVDGQNVISFNSVPAGSFTAPSAFSLGEFLVSDALLPGQKTTYKDTPFS